MWLLVWNKFAAVATFVNTLSLTTKQIKTNTSLHILPDVSLPLLVYPKSAACLPTTTGRGLSNSHLCHCSENLACLHVRNVISPILRGIVSANTRQQPRHNLQPIWDHAATFLNCLLDVQLLAKNRTMSCVGQSWPKAALYLRR